MTDDFDYHKILSIDKNPEYLHSCLKSLTQLEKAIVYSLSTHSAMSIREIQKIIILNVYNQIIEISISKSFNEINLFKIILSKSVADKITKDVKSQNLNVVDSYDSADAINKTLTKYGVKLPSYRTIENNLFDLKNMGLVLERPTVSKRVKSKWFINPKVDMVIKKIYEKYSR